MKINKYEPNKQTNKQNNNKKRRDQTNFRVYFKIAHLDTVYKRK